MLMVKFLLSTLLLCLAANLMPCTEDLYENILVTGLAANMAWDGVAAVIHYITHNSKAEK